MNNTYGCQNICEINDNVAQKAKRKAVIKRSKLPLYPNIPKEPKGQLLIKNLFFVGGVI
ncbi:hypothetical protein KUL106_36880 [Alteromonas sp. KUL106]|nr:hypothetical protein KUL106_36880 [Alteromonas sp. KUL106]